MRAERIGGASAPRTCNHPRRTVPSFEHRGLARKDPVTPVPTIDRPSAMTNVKTADRTLRLFETFAEEARPLPLSELGRLLSIPVSSCLALIRTFQNAGYIYEVRRRSGYYRPNGCC